MPQNGSFKSAFVLLQAFRAISMRPFTTAAQVLQRLEAAGYPRSLRFILRPLDQMGGQFPIECDTRSKPYSYLWRDDRQSFQQPLLSLAKAVLLRLKESQVSIFLSGSIISLIALLFAAAHQKLEGCPGKSLQRRCLDSSRNHCSPTTPPAALISPRMKVFAPICLFINAKQSTVTRYHLMSREESVRAVASFAVVDTGLRWNGRTFDRKSASSDTLSLRASEVDFGR